MSFFFPKVNSKKTKEAYEAFLILCHEKKLDEIDALFYRDDILIKEKMFDYLHEEYNRAPYSEISRLYKRMLLTSSHPYHDKAIKLKAEEDAKKKEQRDRDASIALKRVVGMLNTGKPVNDISKAMKEFNSAYKPLTDDEKYKLADWTDRYIDTWVSSESDKRELFDKWISPYVCLRFVKEHLLHPYVKIIEYEYSVYSTFPIKMVKLAVKELDLPDDEKKKVYLRYLISDGELVTPCEVNRHDYEFVKTISEENYEDYYHPLSFMIYRCKKCGKEKRVSN